MRGSSKAMALVAVAAVGAAGCSAGGEGRDPQGGGPRFTVGDPEVRMGGIDDPDYAFGFVRTAAVGPDGKLYTLHGNESFVRRWTPDGRPDGQIGRAGEGPGEFSAPSDLGFFGDSLWVVDARTYAATYFDGAGTYLGRVRPEVRFATREEGPTGSPPRPQRPLRDGTWLGRKPAWSHEIALGTLSEIPAVRMDAAGTILDTIFVDRMRPTDILALIREDGQGGFYGRQPFGDGNLVSFDDRGVAVVERRAWTGEGPAEYRVLRMASDGVVASDVRIPYPPVPLPAERVDSVVRAEAGRMHGFMARSRPGLTLAQLEGLLGAATYRPAYLPPVQGAFTAADGTIWLQSFVPMEGSDVWRVVGPSGVIREIHLPSGLRPLWSDGLTLWGVEVDEFDVNYIVRYRLEPMMES